MLYHNSSRRQEKARAVVRVRLRVWLYGCFQEAVRTSVSLICIEVAKIPKEHALSYIFGQR